MGKNSADFIDKLGKVFDPEKIRTPTPPRTTPESMIVGTEDPFQKLMDHVLGGLKGAFCYMDDVLLYSETESEHLNLVDELLARLDKNDLALNLSKCQ